MRVLPDLFGGIAGVIHQNFLRHDHRIHRVAESFHIELPVRPHELHQIQRREVARRIVQEHVLAARVRSVDARRVLARIPAVDCGIELHPGVAALVRGFGDTAHQVLRLVTLHGLAGGDALGPPIVAPAGGFHEVVGGSHAVVGVLEEDGTVGFAVQRVIVPSLDQRVRLLLFLGLAPDELVDIGMIHVEDHHLGRAARLAATLDHAGECVEALHETQRSAGAPATRQDGVFFAQGREVRTRAGAPLEQHAFRLGQFQDGFQRVLDADDEAGRTLRPHHAAGFELGHPPLPLVVDPPVAARLFDAHVKPYRRIEAGLLREHQVGQFHAEILAVLGALEVAVLLAPVRDRIHHALHQLRHRRLAVR